MCQNGVSIDVQRDIDDKQKEITKLQGEVQSIAAARAELQKVGQDDLRIFSDNVAILALVWRTAHDDAEEIKRWLEKGAKNAVSA